MIKTERLTNAIKETLKFSPGLPAGEIRSSVALDLAGTKDTDQVPSDLTRFLAWMVTNNILIIKDVKYYLKPEGKP